MVDVTLTITSVYSKKMEFLGYAAETCFGNQKFQYKALNASEIADKHITNIFFQQEEPKKKTIRLVEGPRPKRLDTNGSFQNYTEKPIDENFIRGLTKRLEGYLLER